MIVHIEGDMFTSSAAAFGHGVNVKAAMASGIAWEFVRRFPGLQEAYNLECNEGRLQPGGLFVYHSFKPVFNLASQEYPGADANLAWLEGSLRLTLAFCEKEGIPTLAIPRIGCGIGGLKWSDVGPLMERVSEDYPDIILEVWYLP